MPIHQVISSERVPVKIWADEPEESAVGQLKNLVLVHLALPLQNNPESLAPLVAEGSDLASGTALARAPTWNVNPSTPTSRPASIRGFGPSWSGYTVLASRRSSPARGATGMPTPSRPSGFLASARKDSERSPSH